VLFAGRYRHAVRRGLAVVIGFVVIAVGAVLATVALGGRGDLAGVGRVVCAKEGARVVTPAVAAQVDGLHLQVVNVGKDRRYEVSSRGVPGSGPITGVLPADGVVDLQLALAPGEVEFACLRAGTGERLVALFELQDPAELWTPDRLACAEPDSGVFETDYAVEPFEKTARRALPGIQDADVLAKPGYPDTRWHGELHVVIRGERTVGRVARVLNHGTWNLAVDACPGTGLTQGAVAETGAT
jgi:hypothetical protein